MEDNPAAFHRTVLLFISPDGGQLAAAGAVRALRCQLPRHNRFYAPEPPKKTDVRPPMLPGGRPVGPGICGGVLRACMYIGCQAASDAPQCLVLPEASFDHYF